MNKGSFVVTLDEVAAAYATLTSQGIDTARRDIALAQLKIMTLPESLQMGGRVKSPKSIFGDNHEGSCVGFVIQDE